MHIHKSVICSFAMRRRISGLFRYLSLALCLIVTFLATFSYWRSSTLSLLAERMHRQVHTVRWISLKSGDGFICASQEIILSVQYYESRHPDTSWHFECPSWRSEAPGQPSGGVSVSLWPLAVMLAVPSLRAVLRWFLFGLVKERRAEGLCLSCGYDLRASSDRCPECGLPRLNPRSG
jgi:hypothetical protein